MQGVKLMGRGAFECTTGFVKKLDLPQPRGTRHCEHVRTGRASVRIVPHDPMHKIPRRQAQCNLAEVRTVAVGHARVEQLATPRELELVYFLAEAFFLGADFFLMAFLAGDFLAAAFLAGDFFTAFFAGDFLAAAGFLAADFFLAAAGFLAMVFLTAGFLAGDFLTGFLAADFLAAAGFCDGGSGGTTSVQVDLAPTRAMPRRAHAQGCRRQIARERCSWGACKCGCATHAAVGQRQVKSLQVAPTLTRSIRRRAGTGCRMHVCNGRWLFGRVRMRQQAHLGGRHG